METWRGSRIGCLRGIVLNIVVALRRLLFITLTSAPRIEYHVERVVDSETDSAFGVLSFCIDVHLPLANNSIGRWRHLKFNKIFFVHDVVTTQFHLNINS